MKPEAAGQTKGPIDEIKTVVFIGAGTMGCFNALLAGINGYEAILYDISEEMLQWADFRMDKIGEFLEEKKLFTKAQLARGRNQIHLESDPEKAVKNADLLSESVPERVELKQSVHKQFDNLCPSHTIMTTNTSNLVVSQIEDAVQRVDRFAAMHFHMGSRLVDLVKGPRTSERTLDILHRFVKSLTCLPHIHKKENAGYVYNAIMMGQSTAVWSMVLDHQEKIEDIDRAWMIFHKDKIGPFGIMDVLGLNVYFDGKTGHLEDPEKKELAQKILNFLQIFIDKGEFGIKTGKGFYSYPDPAYQKQEFLITDPKDDQRYRAMQNGLIFQALLLLIDDVASAEDVDRMWMLVKDSDSSGPLTWLDKKGLDTFLSEIKNPVYPEVYPSNRIDDVIAFLNPFLERSELGCKSGKGIHTYSETSAE